MLHLIMKFLVPKLQLGDNALEAPASRLSREAGASKNRFPSWSLGTRLCEKCQLRNEGCHKQYIILNRQSCALQVNHSLVAPEEF